MTSKRNRLALATGALLCGATFAAAQNVTIVRELESNNYDPQKTSALAAAEVLYMLGDTLVAMEPDLKTLVPGLAESWDISQDGLTYTFTLRDDVSFCDGKPFTAADAAYSLNRLADPETQSPAGWRAGKVESITATDDTTLVYQLQEPYSELLFQLTQSFATIIDRDNVAALGDNFGVTGLNTTGPFCWGEWKPRDEMVLTRHEGYTWGPSVYENTGPAQVETITWEIVPEANTRVTALLTGQADLSRSIPYIAFERFRSIPEFQINKSDIAAWTEYFGMKMDRPLMQDIAVRKAMNLAFNQAAMVEDIYYDEVIPATTYMSTTTRDWNPDADPLVADYDVEAAKTMLDEAGWIAGDDGIREKDGMRLAPLFYAFTGSAPQARVEYLQAEMRKIGIDIQIDSFDPTIVWSKLATQEYDMYQMGFAYMSAGDGLNLYCRSENMPPPNRMNWDDAETDASLDAAMRATDDEMRALETGEVIMKVSEAAVWIPIYHEPISIVQSSRLKPVMPHSIQGTGFYKGLDIAVAE